MELLIQRLVESEKKREQMVTQMVTIRRKRHKREQKLTAEVRSPRNNRLLTVGNS